jgi:hypothetical protein
MRSTAEPSVILLSLETLRLIELEPLQGAIEYSAKSRRDNLSFNRQPVAAAWHRPALALSTQHDPPWARPIGDQPVAPAFYRELFQAINYRPGIILYKVAGGQERAHNQENRQLITAQARSPGNRSLIMRIMWNYAKIHNVTDCPVTLSLGAIPKG